MNIFVIGGTGFIGYHATLEFLQRGHRVSTLALPPLPASGLLPAEVNIQLADLNSLDDQAVRKLLDGQDALVFAAGADDRVTPKAPAYEFFYEANVRTPQRLFQLAREAGVHRGVILGSYFAHFDRTWPEMELARHHPYIRSRVAQIAASMQSALPDLALMILELPYIFGAMPGRTPLWRPLVRYLRYPMPLFYSRGGSNCVSVKHVAEAIVGAIEQGTGGEIYQVGDENLTWEALLTRLGQAAGIKKRVITVPDGIIRIGMGLVELYLRLQGKEGGLALVPFTELQTKNAFFDPTPSRLALGYGQGGLDEAFAKTVAAC
jgi:nucleoside-diphosphate-sugar epimerase